MNEPGPQEDVPALPTPAPPTAPSPRKKVRSPHPSVACMVCAHRLPRISRAHLSTHGLTLASYRRMFPGAKTLHPSPSSRPRDPSSGRCLPLARPPAAPDPRSPDLPLSLAPDGPPLIAALASRIAEDADLHAALADEVSEMIASGPLRERVRIGVASVLAARLELHGRAIAQLDEVRARLTEPWRLDQGGDLGAPTSTKDLLALAALHSQEVARGEDLVVRAARLVLEEQRNVIASGLGAVPPADRFAGKSEKIILPTMPDDITPEERETVRLLIGNLTDGMVAIGALPAGERAAAMRRLAPIEAIASAPRDAGTPRPSPTSPGPTAEAGDL